MGFNLAAYGLIYILTQFSVCPYTVTRIPCALHRCNFRFYALRKAWWWLPEVETCSLKHDNVFSLVVLDGLYKYIDTPHMFWYGGVCMYVKVNCTLLAEVICLSSWPALKFLSTKFNLVLMLGGCYKINWFMFKKCSCAPLSTGNTFQDIPQLREAADKPERYM
jgi:hypothetical protein